ncbi:hypothetical protein BDY19DRAFT_990108 [Irpex rosettiformis]|uniref:Uncharacterized protein n=1 Tax=Irpex rosettiformis TaxID=378272 RepID=A0ACB8UGU1_9APHY|nr:hypothetical protein BDY19DRAFT_990108 [Irpex rosettiformis]
MHLSATATVAICMLIAQPAMSIPIVFGTPTDLNLVPSSSNPLIEALRNQLKAGVSETREVHDLMEREELSGIARELEELFARADEDDSEAFSLGNLGKIGGLVLDGFNILGGLIPGGSSQPTPQPSQSTAPQRRDFQGIDARDFIFGSPFTGGVPFFGHGPVEFHPATATAIPTPTPQVVGSLPIVNRNLEERKFVSPLKGFSPKLPLRPPSATVKPIKSVSTSRPVATRDLVEVFARALADVARGLNELD